MAGAPLGAGGMKKQSVRLDCGAGELAYRSASQLHCLRPGGVGRIRELTQVLSGSFLLGIRIGARNPADCCGKQGVFLCAGGFQRRITGIDSGF